MNEDSSVIAEDITEGEESRVIIANPRRYPVLLPVVYAVGNQVGIPVREIDLVYRMRNPRQFLQDFAPTSQNVRSFVISVGISETITFAANAAGIPVLPVIIGFNVASHYGDKIFNALTHLRPSRHIMHRLDHNFALLTDTTRESIDPSSELPIVLAMDEAEDFRPYSRREVSLFSRCCASFWSSAAQQTEPVELNNNTQENSANSVHTEAPVITEYDTSNRPRFGKQKTE